MRAILANRGDGLSAPLDTECFERSCSTIAQDERAKQALDKLIATGNYSDICPDTVKRVFGEELLKRINVRQADKAARARLHAISGAFMTREDMKRARLALGEYARGDASALARALSFHASTRERLASADALFERVFGVTGTPGSILDMACGLNPIYLGARGLKRVTGFDIHGGCAALINECAISMGWDTRAETRDIIASPPDARADMALMMKLMPLLETQSPGAAVEAARRVSCRYIVVTFPTRTLGGRGVGMERHYAEWMDARKSEIGREIDSFVQGTELVYVLERN